jgi:hypothetical protein
MLDLSRDEDRDMNRDPFSGAPGAHPIGTGAGAVSGATAGILVGSVAGPVGTTIGVVVGAIIGGLAGKGLGEAVNPTFDDEPWDCYWREAYRNEPYYVHGSTYEDYSAAYRLGSTFRFERSDTNWDDAQMQLLEEWEKNKGASWLHWEQARPAVYAAWRRMQH